VLLMRLTLSIGNLRYRRVHVGLSHVTAETISEVDERIGHPLATLWRQGRQRCVAGGQGQG